MSSEINSKEPQYSQNELGYILNHPGDDKNLPPGLANFPKQFMAAMLNALHAQMDSNEKERKQTDQENKQRANES